MNPRIRLILAFVAIALLIGALFRYLFNSPDATPPSSTSNVQDVRQQNHQISALGYLEPAGDVRVLAAPLQNTDGSPRLKSLSVEEGQSVSKGQVLAIFDNIDRLDAESAKSETIINSIEAQLEVLQSETERYRSLAKDDVVSSADLETRELRVLELKAQLRQAIAEAKQVQTEKTYAKLVSPIDGVVLKVNARVGERPGQMGVIEVGDVSRMEAVAQVDENRITSIFVGQSVTINSENKSFDGTLSGTVRRISPRVSRRQNLSRTPSADQDVEERVIDVRIGLDPSDADAVRNLSGARIVAKFKHTKP